MLRDEKDLTCEDRPSEPGKADYFTFSPVHITNLINDGDSTVYTEGRCFGKIEFTIEYPDKTENGDFETINIRVKGSEKKSTFCHERLWLASLDKIHPLKLRNKKEHVVSFKKFDEDEKLDIRAEGIRLFEFCEGEFATFISIFKTVKLFLGGIGTNPKLPWVGSHVPKYMEKANVEFLGEALNMEFVTRSQSRIDIDESNIRSGDFLAIYRLDGLDPIVMWGTGGTIGHCVAALWIDEQLYIVESQDGWYWPKGNIQRNTFKQWMQWAENADFHVAHMPLSDEKAAQFDEKKALEWFETKMEGYPYGYHNFIFSWIDTEYENFPPALPRSLGPIAFTFLEHILPSVMTQFVGEALN